MNLLALLDILDECKVFEDDSANTTLLSVIGIARRVVRVLQIAIPIILIIWGSIDMGKAIIEGKEDKIKEKQKPFFKRIVTAVLVFLIPWIVDVVIGLVGSDDWKECWNASKNYDFQNIDVKRQDQDGNFNTD